MQQWTLLLSDYSYSIKFCLNTAHGNADGLLDLPLASSTSVKNCDDAAVFNIGQIDTLPPCALEVMEAMCPDPVLSKVLRYVKAGWPVEVSEELPPFWRKRDEIMVEADYILW